jgi:hypothetical protein
LEYDLELWLEVGVTNGPDRNQVYDISMIMAQDVRSNCNVLSVGTPQFGVNKPLPFIKELVKQQIDAMRDEMEAKYEEKKKQQWKEMIAYMSYHYPPSYEPPKDFTAHHLYLQPLFNIYKHL